MHIGGARVALYDWLLAKKHGGVFVLRIEDTDRARYVPEALEDFKESLRWLGLKWDEGPEVGGPVGPYFQSERLDLYRRYLKPLVDEGKAYHCFCSPERLERVREERKASGQFGGYDRFCRDLSPKEVEEKLSKGQSSVIRFKMPLEGKTIVKDALRGEMVFENQTLDDFVLLKSDGFPTYHLAHVIDDHLMKITHVLRGEEWIASSPRHLLLFEALNWKAPVYVHLPIFLSPDGKGKLSKRHGATSLREYREQGYLPEAVVNFLLLLGWHPSDDRELFTLPEAVEAFSLERINTSPVAFSPDKLDWLNGVYLRELTSEDLAERCLPFLQKSGLLPIPCPAKDFDYLVTLMPLVRERLKLLTEISDWVSYFLREEIEPPPVDLLVPRKGDPKSALKSLEEALNILEKEDDFSVENLERSLKKLAADLGIKPGQLFMPIRVAVTGATATPGLFETLAALGKERVLDRLGKAIAVLRQSAL